MANRQTSVQLTENTERQVDALKGAGFGTFTDIVRLSIDRMYHGEIETTLVPVPSKSADFDIEIIAPGVGSVNGLLVMQHYCAVCRYDGSDGEGDCVHKQMLREVTA